VVYPDLLLDLPFNAQFNSAWVAGALNWTLNLDPTSILSTWTRYSAIFSEYLLQGVRLKVEIGSGGTAPAGFIACALEERNGSLGAAVLASPHLEIPLTSVTSDQKPYQLSWVATDFDDLTFRSLGTASSAVYFYAYGNPGNTGTTNTTSVQVRVSGVFALRLRGFLA